ncbi:HlyD family efflux transporter periplasmic adaptor subunit [Bordetella trematum]|uniref:HlyD family efflux transporter periplasmic adaptor subunit n=1 Tax=Bordetella trematum TaxID=123899 RepID=UPI0039891B7C
MAVTALYSQSWHRVSELRPRLRSHIHIHRHIYRGEVWYVMQDQANGEFHRYTPEANLLIRLMDGRRTVQEIWETACSQLDDDAMPQDEVIRLLSQLHRADVLVTDRAPDVRDLVQRRRRQRIQKIKQYIGNPSALKVPLLDPDRGLTAALPYYRWIFSWIGGLLWLAVVIWGAALAAMHWQDLTHNVWDQVFSAGNVLAMALVYPVVKAIHELGHAAALKVRGGEVHEIGVMFLLLVPIPYVDATAAAGFADKRWRMLVGAAGILVELFLAAVAMIAWTQLEPGLWRSLAYNVIILCGISTLFMNGNPLLRYDGYYVLSDAIEIPNLGQRANGWLGYLFKRYVLGLSAVQAPRASRGEQWWFVGYALLSFFYRMFIMFLAIFLIAGQFFFFGVLLAVWSLWNTIVMPLWRMGRQLFTDPQIQARRKRSYAITTLCVLGLVGLLGMLPMPSSTDTEGVVWVPPSAQVRAPVAGFVRERQVADDAQVQAGDPLLSLLNDELVRREAMLAAQVDEYQARYVQAHAQNPVQAAIMQHQWQSLKTERQAIAEQVSAQQVRSPQAGRFLSAYPEDETGRYVQRGELLGYVMTGADTVRVVVPQSSLERIHDSLRNVQVRLVQDSRQAFNARIAREVPSATDELPSLALSLQGGGTIGVDPRKSQEGRAKSSENLFVMDLALPPQAPRALLGGRVYVKFEHEPRPIAVQAYDALRQLVLRQLRI